MPSVQQRYQRPMLSALMPILLIPLLLMLMAPHACQARFYIGRYKTIPSEDLVGSDRQARSFPYIVYPGEAGSEAVLLNQNIHRRWRVETPPIRRLGKLEPAGAFGLTNNYGNDPYRGYSLVRKGQVKYVIPPFTPGGRVHVAFQFWIPISLGGFFVTGRELEAALKSPNPTAYITTLFLKHLSANTTAEEILGHLDAPVVDSAINTFLEWVTPHFHHLTGHSVNTVKTYMPRQDKNKKQVVHNKPWRIKKRRRRSLMMFPDADGSETQRRTLRQQRQTADEERSLMEEVANLADVDASELELQTYDESKSRVRRKKRQIEENKSMNDTHETTAENNEEQRQATASNSSTSGGLELRVQLHERNRQGRGVSSGGWVMIGGRGPAPHGIGEESITPTSPLLTRPSPASSLSPSSASLLVPHNRLLWEDDQDHPVIMHNHLNLEQDKRPGIDLAYSIDSPLLRPHPPSSSLSSWPSFLTRPASPPPSPSSFNPSHISNSHFSDTRPSFPSHFNNNNSDKNNNNKKPPRPFRPAPPPSSSSASLPFPLASFDDLPSAGATTSNLKGLDVRSRLSRLDYLFTNFHLQHEDCRRRILCEVAREPDTFAPLSDMVHGETRLPGNPLDTSRELLNTAEGARLLSYVEAVRVGEDRSQVCDSYRYRCRLEARQVINTDILPIWREMVRWLTVKVLTRDSSKLSLPSG